MEAYEFSSFGKEMVDVNESDYKLWLCYLLMSTKAFSIVPCVEQMLKMCLLVGSCSCKASIFFFCHIWPTMRLRRVDWHNRKLLDYWKSVLVYHHGKGRGDMALL